jgi:hypothetical protein
MNPNLLNEFCVLQLPPLAIGTNPAFLPASELQYEWHALSHDL